MRLWMGWGDYPDPDLRWVMVIRLFPASGVRHIVHSAMNLLVIPGKEGREDN